MKLSRRYFLWFAVVLAVVTSAGCTKDDDADCVGNLTISYTFQKGAQNLFASDVSSISLFVFDERNILIGRYDETDATKLTNDYKMTVSLLPGRYKCVAWGGLKNNNYYLCHQGEDQLTATGLIVGVSTMEDVILRLQCDYDHYAQYQEHIIDYQPDDLYYGKELDITLKANKENNVTIDLVKNNTQIKLTVKGLPMPTRSHPFTQMDIYFESPNGGYDFTNNIETDCDKYKYMPLSTVADQNNYLYFDIHTLKMKFGNGHDLVIFNNEAGVEFLRADLLEEYIRDIAKYSTQEAVDAEDLFEIVITVNANMTVSVTVNGWTVQNSGSGMQ